MKRLWWLFLVSTPVETDDGSTVGEPVRKARGRVASVEREISSGILTP
jgi:hypothetical protein